MTGVRTNAAPVAARACLLLLSLVALAPFAHADELSPQDLLARMSASMRDLDYQGSFIYEHGGRIDSLRVFHAGGAHERERVISLGGARSEIVRDGAVVTCIQPGAQPIVISGGRDPRLLPLVPDPSAEALETSYAVARAGEDRVAGYAADVIDIVPRDHYRYGYRVWIGQDNHMLLRSQVLGDDRQPLEQFMFVALEVGVAPKASDLLPSRTSGNAATTANEVAIKGASRWQVTAVPAGFVLAKTQHQASAGDGAIHLVYSDGLASVSIYIDAIGDQGQVRDTLLSRGALNVFSHRSGAWRITALGNVPAVTLEHMSASLQQVDAAP